MICTMEANYQQKKLIRKNKLLRTYITSNGKTVVVVVLILLTVAGKTIMSGIIGTFIIAFMLIINDNIVAIIRRFILEF